MVRTPLARRIPGNDRLNAVDCLLPYFDREAVDQVVKSLRDGSGEMPPTGRILINPVEMKPNPDVPDTVWSKFVSLPSQTRPQRGAKPAVRLTALAHELASDGLLPGAGGKAHAAMHAVLDAFIADPAKQFAEKRASVMTVEGRTIIADLRKDEVRDEAFDEAADEAVVGDAFRRTARIISPDIARTYTLARAKRHDADDFDDALIEAREDVAALHLLENLQVSFDAEATKLADAWLAEYKDRIKQLPHDRQDAYRQIVALSTQPQDVDLAQPTSRFEPTRARETNGNESAIPTYKQHLLCDDQGAYPAELNDWEKAVLRHETERDGFRFWYRNPDRTSQDSLGIAWWLGNDARIMRPDFIFFSEHDGEIVADIIDPHGVHLADALPKLQGLAAYAAAHEKTYRRIVAVAEVGGSLRMLDMTRTEVRAAVAAATNVNDLYVGALGSDYG